jgi:hypothetical protein
MSASTQKNLELFLEGAASESLKKPCTELVEALKSQIPAKRLPQAEPTEVTGFRIEGDRGFVIYRDAGGTEWAFPVVREGSAWKVATIVGAKFRNRVRGALEVVIKSHTQRLNASAAIMIKR